jgi:hypothetical protein
MKTATRITLIALLWLIVINSGTVGSLDTELRLQMAHAWWTGTDEVIIPSGYQLKVRGDIVAGVMGAGGKRYIAYEVGQSMLMLPADWLGSQLHQFFPLIDQEFFRSLMVNLLVFIPLSVATVAGCFWLLQLLGWQERIAALTSLTWFMGTTVLHYAQVPQQNNQVLLFVLLGYASALVHSLRGQVPFVLLSGLSLGAALLVRSTSTIHALTVLLFLAGCIAYRQRDKIQIVKAIALWIAGFLPLALVSRILDYIRYGNFWVTGKLVEQQQLATDPMWEGLPQLPPGYPLINDSHVGILGPLLFPAKSIFLYDPFLLPCILLAIVFWKKLSPLVQWYLATTVINLGLHLLTYSRFVFWHGDWAWAARYHVTSVQLILIPLLALFITQLLSAKKLGTPHVRNDVEREDCVPPFNIIPLLRNVVKTSYAWVLRGILVLAIALQMASVTLPFHLENAQAQSGAPGSRLQLRLGQRALNIACLVNGSISDRCISQLPPNKRDGLEEYNHVYFFPFVLQHQFPSSSVGLQVVLFLIWGLALVLAIAISMQFMISPM